MRDFDSKADALSRSEERFRMLADNMSQLAWTCDLLGNVTWYNKRWLDYTGLSFEDMKGWGWSKVQHPDHVDRVVDRVKRSSETGEPWEDTFPLRGKDGNYRWFLSRAQPIRDEQGGLVQWFGTNTDVTEQVLAEEQVARQARELRALNERLRELDRLKTEFFANASHEFRTPLALMLGPLEDLLDEPAQHAPPGNRELLEIVHRSGLRLQKLVNTLLDFSRIEAGRVEAVYEPTDLGSHTAELASSFRSACEWAGIRLVTECPPLDEPVYVDRDMWEKIVLNLVSNAFKFTFEGGITVAVRSTADSVELSVRDTGTGIPEDEIPRLFERFHRVKGARGRTHEGTGIGLALVQELVELHGGTVGVESIVGEGSEFVVSIPKGEAHLPPDRIGVERILASTAVGASPYVEEALRWLPDSESLRLDPSGPRLDLGAASASPSRAGVPAEQGAHRARVLWADDNADMRDYVRRLLSPHYEVLAVADGKAALAAARALRPELVLADVMMPQLDGFELLRELRADPGTRTVPVILISARAGEESRLEGLAAGADDYLVKPFGARELLARVSARLELASMRARLEQGEERYRRIFDSAGVSIWVEDFSAVKAALDDLEAGGVRDLRRHLAEHPELVRRAIGMVRVVDVNEASLRMFGATDKSELMDSLSRIFTPETEPIFLEELLALAEGKASFESEAVVRTLQGERIDVAFTIAFPDTSEKLDRVLVSLLDITERTKAERELRETTETLQVLDSVGKTLSAELDLQDLVQAVTDAATKLSGASFGAFFYSGANEEGEFYTLYVLSGAEREAFAHFPLPRNTALFGPTFRGEGPVRIDDVTRDARYGNNPPYRGMPEGHLPVKSYLAVPVASRSGEVLGGLFFGHPEPGVFSPRHERIVAGIAAQAAIAIDNARLYEAEQRARAQAEKANLAKDRFLATLSHELRTPLNAIYGWAHMLREGTLDSANLERAVEVIERNALAQTQLIEDLLDVSRIVSGKLHVASHPVDLAAVVSGAIDSVRPAAASRGVELHAELETIGSVQGDAPRLQQVVGNLLSNAVKFTPPGGHVYVTSKREEDDARIIVRDTGRGIESEMLPKIFESFHQADESTTRAQAGLGIGLTIVKHLVEAHGGAVAAESPGPDRGATFTLRLPIAGSPPPTSALRRSAGEAAETPPTALAGIRVLVIEDDPDGRELLRFTLEHHGAAIAAVGSAAEALDVLRGDAPVDVIVADIAMPQMDGYTLMERIRKLERGDDGHIPAVALTAFAREEDRDRALRAGYEAHLAKPVDPSRLLATIRELTASRGRR